MSGPMFSDDVRERAACWHDRIHCDRTSEDTVRQLNAWLAQSPAHRAAYENIERTWAHLRSLAQDPQILEFRHETALRLTRSASAQARPLKVAAAAAVMLGIGLAFLSTIRQNGDHSMLTDVLAAFHGHHDRQYSTATGERLTVNLEDGSQVTLDTQSAVSVNYTQSGRWIRLTRGQALFEVAKDRFRPFVVDVSHRRLVAIGTAFDVRLEGAQVKVTMVEGTVRVEQAAVHGPRGPTRSREDSVPTPGTPSLKPTATITAGEQLVADDRNQVSIRPADAERTTSWRHGQIIFDDTRLADAVVELNRYSQVKLQLADPSLADRRLSGAFATGRPQLFLEALTSYFPIEATQIDAHLVFLKARR